MNQVRGEHRRKTGFMAGFEEIVAGSGRSEKPSFLERAKAPLGWATHGGTMKRFYPDGDIPPLKVVLAEYMNAGEIKKLAALIANDTRTRAHCMRAGNGTS